MRFDRVSKIILIGLLGMAIFAQPPAPTKQLQQQKTPPEVTAVTDGKEFIKLIDEFRNHTFVVSEKNYELPDLGLTVTLQFGNLISLSHVSVEKLAFKRLSSDAVNLQGCMDCSGVVVMARTYAKATKPDVNMQNYILIISEAPVIGRESVSRTLMYSFLNPTVTILGSIYTKEPPREPAVSYFRLYIAKVTAVIRDKDRITMGPRDESFKPVLVDSFFMTMDANGQTINWGTVTADPSFDSFQRKRQ